MFYFILILSKIFLRRNNLLRTRVQFFHHVCKLLSVILIVHFHRSLKNDQFVEPVRDCLCPLYFQPFDLFNQLPHFLRVLPQMVIRPFYLDLIVLGFQLRNLQLFVHLLKTALFHGLVALIGLMHPDRLVQLVFCL